MNAPRSPSGWTRQGALWRDRDARRSAGPGSVFAGAQGRGWTRQGALWRDVDARRSAGPGSVFAGALGGLQLSLPLPTGTFRVTSGYGPRTNPVTHQAQSLHNGQDLAAPEGTPVYAAAAGVVAKVYENHPTNGNAIVLAHADTTITGTGYLHLSELGVRQGDLVRVGQQIGRVGSTGRSTGPHLHFIVYVRGAAEDPAPYLRDARARVAPTGRPIGRWPWWVALGSLAVGAGTLLLAARARPLASRMAA